MLLNLCLGNLLEECDGTKLIQLRELTGKRLPANGFWGGVWLWESSRARAFKRKKKASWASKGVRLRFALMLKNNSLLDFLKWCYFNSLNRVQFRVLIVKVMANSITTTS